VSVHCLSAALDTRPGQLADGTSDQMPHHLLPLVVPPRAEAAQDLVPIAIKTSNQDLALDVLRVVNSLIGLLRHCWRQA